MSIKLEPITLGNGFMKFRYLVSIIVGHASMISMLLSYLLFTYPMSDWRGGCEVQVAARIRPIWAY